MAWCFEDEHLEYANFVLDSLTAAVAVVPPIWPLEVANVLAVGERRGRIRSAESARFVTLLQQLPIVVDDQATGWALESTLTLAREAELSAYDATYLDLARRRGLALASTDERLRRGATKAEVSVLNVE